MKKTKEQFIEDARSIHGDKYDYSKAEYVNGKTKVCIICPEHGEFWQTPNAHLVGKGCAACAKRPKIDTTSFINRAKLVHGDKYDYSKVEYINAHTKVCLIDNKSNKEIWVTPDSLLRAKGKFIKPKNENLSTINDITHKNNNISIIERIRKIHGDKYDYEEAIVYKKGRPYITAICHIHGAFLQRLDQHLSGKGCPKCKNSKGESFIENQLNYFGIKFEKEKMFNNLRGANNGLLRFDFYIPDFKTCIEYQGKQHYKANDFFGGAGAFKQRLINDNIKAGWCAKNNMDLIIINKCPHGSFCEKDRLTITEAIKNMLDKKLKKE